MSNKIITSFFCKNCGNEFPKWYGKCPACNEWNTLTEEKFTSKKGGEIKKISSLEVSKLNEIDGDKEKRYSLVDKELSRVLGGGLVQGSLVLLGGEPGIGKSTLLLQLALNVKSKVLYVSGEESSAQIKMRASRINKNIGDNIYIYTETNLESILDVINKEKPNLLIIDSIQTIYSNHNDSFPGSVGQIRDCTSKLMNVAKSSGLPIFIIGHITKEGTIAGPKILEHMVDTVLQFEGEKNGNFKLLRSMKNRFGSTNEVGIYEMNSNGLKPIDNPSKIFLYDGEEERTGVSIALNFEGLRPIMVEVQCLVSSAVYGTPQRSVNGFDIRRLNMLLAVLEKRCGFKLSIKDVFLNIAGGIKIDDPAVDLAVIVSILSSDADLYVKNSYCFVGEVGLSGEIRPVSKLNLRISEAAKMGYEKVFVSKNGINFNELNLKKDKIEIIQVSKIDELFKKIF